VTGSFYELLTNVNEDKLKKIVELKVKEDIRTGFYPASFLDPSSQKKTDFLSILVSSFANSNGGILIFGIHSQRKKASTFDFVTDEQVSIDWLKYSLESSISPSIGDLSISEVCIDENPGKRIFVIKVHNTNNAPHMASDKRYYKRVECRELLLEEFEVRELYHRTIRPELDVFAILNTNGVPSLEGGKFLRVNFYPRFLVKNIGAAIEDNFKVELYVPSGIYNSNFTVLQQHFARLEEQYSVFSVSNKSPLFQHELATVLEANFVIDRDNFHIFAKNDVLIKLYYSSGMKLKQYNLLDTFLYRNERLRFEEFSDQASLFA